MKDIRNAEFLKNKVGDSLLFAFSEMLGVKSDVNDETIGLKLFTIMIPIE